MVVEYQLLPHGYSILDYSRAYDPEFRELIERLEAFYYAMKKKKKKNHHHQYHTKPCFCDISYANRFSKESVFIVLSYLDGYDLLAASQVNKEWNELASQNCLWDTLLVKNFSLTLDSIQLLQSKPTKKGNKNKVTMVKMHPTEGKVTSKHLYRTMEGSFRDLVASRPLFKSQPTIPASFLL